jgi:hypothetical protein
VFLTHVSGPYGRVAGISTGAGSVELRLAGEKSIRLKEASIMLQVIGLSRSINRALTRQPQRQGSQLLQNPDVLFQRDDVYSQYFALFCYGQQLSQ